MTLPLAFDILQSGVRLSLICAVVGLGCAFVLIAVILRSSPGNERMRQISGAVQEGAKAYLNRQVMTISVIAVIIFLLLFFFKDHATAFGFLIGAFCSLAAGYIGMRIAVLANGRVTQAAAGQSRTAALRVELSVGAALVGKIRSGWEEDDPRSPATIADNVGDNVGDCAGMAADVFEPYAVSL